MGLLALKVSVDGFQKRLTELDTKLNILNRIKSDYEQLVRDMRNNITSEDSDSYAKLEERAKYQIEALTANINMALATRAGLAKVVEEASQNGQLVNGILDDSINVVGNTVHSALDAAKIAVQAAGVAAVL